jgi:hypothetical protein
MLEAVAVYMSLQSLTFTICSIDLLPSVPVSKPDLINLICYHPESSYFGILMENTFLGDPLVLI